MKARFIHEIGTRIYLRIYWDGTPCAGPYSCHNAMIKLMDSSKLHDWTAGGEVEDYPDDMWSTKCNDCGEPVPKEGAHRQVHQERLYNTASGKPEPGDLYYMEHENKKGYCSCHWDNCDCKHLYAVLPNGHIWDIDGRASNCTMPNDKKHRCWVRHGEPPMITVDKNGDTCSAGAGSILSGNYHGFLRNGEFTGV